MDDPFGHWFALTSLTINDGIANPVTLEELETLVASASTPPVDTWHPDHVGSMDMIIRRDGRWWHEGGEIKRHGMVRLFASILRCEADGRHCLVTPAEKLYITVEDSPFIATKLYVHSEDPAGTPSDSNLTDDAIVVKSGASVSEDPRWVLGFETNVGDTVIADAIHPISVTFDAQGNPTPYVHVRHGLLARLERSVYYELAELCVEHQGRTGVWSRGVFHSLDGQAA